MSKIEVNTVDVQCGSTLTLGSAGKTVTIASGASTSGMGRTGTVDWCTTAKTSPLTGVSGKGYFINTTGGVVTVTLPSSPTAGDIIAIADYTNTFQTNAVTVGRGGSKIGGVCANASLETQGQSVTFVYVDATEGWKNIQDSTSNVTGETFLSASGGNATVTCGNFKTHIFTGSGTFTVNSISGSSSNNNVDYLVVAGAGGSGTGSGGGGGGGAGGFRVSNSLSLPAPTMSPLVSPTGLPVTATGYPITIGAGGAGSPNGSAVSNNGTNSVFSTITSAGGGGGGAYNPALGLNGGSGGGGGDPDSPPSNAGGSGNTPGVSPPQGNNGGSGSPPGGSDTPQAGGGGGGAGGVGTAGTQPSTGGAGGVGSYVSNSFISPAAPSYGTAGPVSSVRYFAGGGGGSAANNAGAGGAGGGGAGSSGTGNTGTANTGGGAGGAKTDPDVANRSGGSGIVMIRYRFQ